MNRTNLITSLVFLAMAILFGGLYHSQKRANEQLIAQLEKANQTIGVSKTVLDTSSATARQLESKVVLLAEVLSNSTERLNAANTRLKAYETGSVGSTNQAEAALHGPAQNPTLLAELMSQVPAPSITWETNKAGVAKQIFHFDRLMGVNGQEIATNVTFGGIYGRRLVFRREGATPLAFDVDELHPGDLAYLKIDPYAAKAQQADLDEKHRQQDEQNQKNIAARNAAEQKMQEAIAAANAERSKQEEQKRLAQSELDLKYKQIDNDRLKAEAAMRQAEAAVIQAMNPVPVIVTGNNNFGAPTVGINQQTGPVQQTPSLLPPPAAPTPAGQTTITRSSPTSGTFVAPTPAGQKTVGTR